MCEDDLANILTLLQLKCFVPEYVLEHVIHNVDSPYHDQVKAINGRLEAERNKAIRIYFNSSDEEQIDYMNTFEAPYIDKVRFIDPSSQ